MQKVREPLLTQPEYFGTIDASIFDEIHDVLSDKRFPTFGFLWTPEQQNGGHPSTQKLKTTLGELTDRLCEYMASTQTRKTRIHYSFDAQPVISGKSQRGTRWHYDNNAWEENVVAIVAANTLTTEFLAASDNTTAGLARAARFVQRFDPKSNGFWDEPIQNGLDAGVLQIYRPEPLEAVIMTDHVHRSRVNEGLEDIERVWLRATLE